LAVFNALKKIQRAVFIKAVFIKTVLIKAVFIEAVLIKKRPHQGDAKFTEYQFSC
jgi:hypothetical protein